MKRYLIFLFLILNCSLLFGQSILPYTMGQTWDEKYGNHRAVIRIDNPADAVHIDFLWRRHDKDPDKRKMWIINAQTGEEIKNIQRVTINNEQCELVFGPVTTTGDYFFYYLPYNPVTDQFWAGDYYSPENKPEVSWIDMHNLNGEKSKWKNVVSVQVKELQARQEFHSFFPMEVIATQKEVQAYIDKHPLDYLVFPEDRSLPIRMLDAIPQKWMSEKPSSSFSGTAQRDEYYTLQIGVYASRKPLENLSVSFSDLSDLKGNTIQSEKITCFNTGGINCHGALFTKRIRVEQNRVQPMWIGIDIGKNVQPGKYSGTFTVTADNVPSTPVEISLIIEDKIIEARGDNDLWRHSRLRWLNSTLGIDTQPVAPYSDLVVNNRRVSCLGRSVDLDDYGMPMQITSWENQILSSPVRFVIETENEPVKLHSKAFRITEQKSGIVKWISEAEDSLFKLTCLGEIEFDGRLSYQCTVQSKQTVHVQDIRLEFPMKQEFGKYMMGMSRMGGYTPKTHLSRWTKVEDSFWIGNTVGGIQCELRGGRFHGPLLNLYQPSPPSSWFNGVNGGFRIDTDEYTGNVTASVFSGARGMKQGQSVNFEFALLITPVKQVDMKTRITDRYFHHVEPTKEVIENGGNVMNVHHANKYNPYINYPFVAREEMRGLIDQWHAKGWKVKIYYTVRELSNFLTEIWALRSLGSEILPSGPGGGYQWLREHLVTDYTPQWYTHIGDGTVDAAILNSGESRWYNYYIEGLAWLMKNMDIDGLYLDDVSFDRRTLKRIRRVMDQYKPGECMIDLHSNTAFSLGSANQNMELFPYVEKTWFGEGFNFDLFPAEFWLVEVSGIPFGVTNDMLRHMSVNPSRDMVFGMTDRSNVPIWKLWDYFGIGDSHMVGFWEKEPVVTTNNSRVYATAYVKTGSETLIAIGSWVDAPVEVQLNINWEKIGLSPDKVTIEAPEVDQRQGHKKYKRDEKIILSPKGEKFIILKSAAR